MSDNSLMDVMALIDKAEAAGARISFENEELLIQVPRKKKLDNDLLVELRAKKEQLTAYFRDHGVYATVDSKNIIRSYDRKEGDRIPLSHNQERLWFIDHLEGSVQYHMSSAIRLTGQLDVNALQHAFRQIIQRHEVLRTVIREEEGKAYQHIRSGIDWDLQLVDGAAYKDSSHELKTRIAALRDEPFALSADWMLRASLVRLSDDENVLLIVVHHIAADGWSVSIIVKELVALYAAYMEKRTPTLSSLPLQYADFALWEQEYLAAPAWQADLAYWQKKLQGVENINLPADYPRPAIQSTRGASTTFRLDKQLTDKLNSLSREHGSTLFMTLLSAFKVLLFRYSRQSDICIGTAIANRRQWEVEGLVGFFMNTLALRSTLDEDMSFIELLEQVKETTLNAYEHQDAPFGKLVDVVVKHRDPGRNPLIQAMFVLQNTPAVPGLRLGELTLSEMPVEDRTSKFDLSFLLTESGDGIHGVMEFCTDLFSAGTISQMLKQYEALLYHIVKQPAQQLKTLQLINEQDYQLLLSGITSDGTSYPADKTIVDLFREQAAATPGNTAIVFEGRSLTYKELDTYSNSLGNYLKHKGVKEGDLVPLCLKHGQEMMIGMLGILKAGAAYVPVDPMYPAERISYMLEDTMARHVLSDTEAIKDVRAAGDLTVVLMDKEWDEITAFQADEVSAAITPDTAAYVIYTSGSTGKPKGVIVTHRNVVRLFKTDKPLFDFNERDVWTMFHSSCFDFSVWEMYGALFYGGKLIILSREAARDTIGFAALLATEGVTVLNQTPGAFYALQEIMVNTYSKHQIRYVIFGGEALNPVLLKPWKNKYPSCRLINMYGITETTVHVTYKELTTKDIELGLSNIGKPIPTLQCYILDSNGALLPPGIAGEIYVGGAGVSKGYLNRPELTSERFIKNPFGDGKLYRTGDQGRLLADGNIVYLGRIDNQVKIRGYRIELGEIENALQKTGLVSRAVVLPVADGQTSRLICYYVPDKNAVSAEPQPGGINDDLGKEIREILASQLPDYMVPADFSALPDLPLTANGKVDKKLLTEIYRTTLDTATAAYIAPVEDREQVLISICEEVLRRRPIGMLDDFFALGGDSIKSIQVVSRLRQHGYYLSVKDVLMYPQLKQLSERIRRSEREVSQGVVEGLVQLGAIQHAFFEHGYKYPGHYNQAVLLESLQPLEESTLRALLSRIIAHHDALRMVYRLDADGTWQQQNLGLEQEYGLHVYDMRGVADWDKQMLAACNEIQSGIDLQTGPLLQVGLFIFEDVSRILLAAHHLVIDGVSWRILFEDLSILLGQHQRGEALQLPRKSDSFQYWQEQVRHYSNSEELKQEHAYWSSLEQRSVDAIPVDHPGGSNLYRDERSEHYVLSETLTQQLQGGCHQVYGTDINDLLLCALGLSFKEVFGVRDLLLRQEGHGREQLGVSEVDVTRTVGWFTSVYPVLLAMGEGGEQDVLSSLVRVKEQLHRVPNKGVGYGILRYISAGDVRGGQPYRHEPEVTFNYLGDFGVGVEDKEGERYFTYSGYGSGNTVNEEEEREDLLSVQGIVAGGRLRITVSYSGLQYDKSTIQRLLDSYGRHLEVIIDRLSKEEGRYKTPVDFTYKGLSIAELSELERTGAVEDVYELTPLQQGMYYHWLSSPSSSAYFEQIIYRIEGELDRASLEYGYKQIVARHAVLRTSFTDLYGSVALQVVQKEAVPAFTFLDLRADSSFDLKAYAAQDRSKGFNLEEGSQMRLTVLQTGEKEYTFLWSHHHILMDGWCTGIIIREFYQLYYGHRQDRMPVLPAVAPYSGYIRWLQTADHRNSLDYWKHILNDYNTAARFPSNPVSQTTAKDKWYKEKDIVIDAGLLKQLRSLCAELAITENTFIQTAWGVLLSKYNNTRDVVYGAVVSGRPSELTGVEDMVGLFINTIPVRIRYDADMSVSGLLRQVQLDNINGLPHHHVQLAEIQSQSDLGRKLIDHILVFENYPVQDMVRKEMEERFELKIKNTDFFGSNSYDLTVLIVSDAIMKIQLKYDTGLYTDTFMEHLAANLCETLSWMLNHSNELITNAGYLNDKEHKELLSFTHVAYKGVVQDVVSRFESIVQQVPGNRAVIAGNGVLTYGELNSRANQLSAYLIKQHGVKKGNIIGVRLDRADKWLLVAMMAILKSAAAFLPLDGDEDNARFNAIVDDAGCKVIINPALISSFENDEEVYTTEDPQLPVTGADICYVIYTSGTTGKPKGVMIHHRALLNYLEGIAGVSGIGMNDSSVITSSYAFDLIYTSLFSTIFNGGAIHLIPEDVVKTPVQLANYIIQERVTFLKLTPTLFNVLANYSDIAELLGTSSIRLIFLGGEPPLPSNIKLICRYPHIRLFNHYGPTETTIGACVHEITDDNLAGFLARPVVGKPLANNYVYILDKNYQMLPAGAVGEICIGGEGVSSGYLHRQELTAEKFREDAWKPGRRIYCTGDLGRRLEDGNIMFLGRMDDQVKIRGYRVELGEVEEVMRRVSEVEEAKVVVRKYDFGEQELVAYWIGDETLTGMSLRNELSRSLPSYMIPAYFVHLESFPVTGNGKLDYSALPQPSEEDWYGQEYIAPVEDREQVLIGICEEVLRRRPIGMLDDFFALGGDSIKSIQVVSRLRQHGYYLSVKDVLMYPQLKQLSERIRRSEREVSQGVVEGLVQLGAIQHAFFEHGYKYPGHNNQAVLLESLQPLEESTLRALLSRIIAHHDALRMVYLLDADGNWQQQNLGLEQEYGLHVYDMRGVADWDKQMLAACNEIQSGIDLQTGPLLQVGLFIFEDVSRILLAAHHLVIDGVSWRILFEDLSILLGQHQRGEALQLPRKSDSFQYWQEQVRHYSNSEELKQEHAYWSSLEQRSVDAIPVDHPGGSNLYHDERSEHYVLSETLTQQLQGGCHHVYGTDINDLLLCALGLSFKEVFGVRDLLLRQEGHGREQLGASEVDVTRTVGWFTSVYPVLLAMGEGGEQDVLSSLVRVKEQLHRVPNKGVGYGILRYISAGDVRGGQPYRHEPEVTFNYLGDFGVGVEDKEGERYFTYAGQGSGNTINDQEERSELLSVQGIVAGGRLRITVSYSGLQYDKSTIQRLLDSYGRHLEAIIDRLSKEEGRYKTPVDFTYKGLSIAELSELERTGAVEDVYELTPLQQGMYYHWLSSPSSSAYFEQIAYQITGELDVKALEDAYYFIIERHAILRTGFTYNYGVPLQVVRKNVKEGFVYRDVSAEKGFSVAAFVSADRMAGFDLNGHSQMRLTVLKTSAGEYNFSWCNHHIVMDGWCSGIIINEFYQVYSYFSSGKTPVLDKVYPYASYVRWLSRVNPDVSLNYWSNYLSDYSSVASVPAVNAGKGVANREMRQTSVVLSQADVSRIRSLCSEMGITENSFFQTAWGILLGRYNNTRDVVFGGVVSGRPAELEGVERIVGLFINTVPLRLKYDADMPVSALLKDMQAANIEGMGHHYIQLAQIQSRHELGAALFDHVFIFENYPVEEMVAAAGKEQGASINILSTEVFAENNYPFSIVILPGAQVEVRFMYDAGKYTDTAIERLSGHFQELISNMIADPLRNVAALSYIPLAERRQLWNDSNGPEITYPVDKTLPQLFTEQAVRRADHPAVVFRDHMLTYEELDRLSDNLAYYLSSHCGLLPGDVAGMKLKRNGWAIVSILGIMKAGCVYVPIDVAYPPDRIAYMEQDSACRAILDETFIGQFRSWAAANPGARISAVPSTAADLAYILYTSGSTGMPKGVMLEHGTVINTLYNIRDIVGVTEDDNGLEFSSLSFDSSISEIFMVLLSGATLHMVDEEVKSDPLKLRDYIRLHQVSLASLPPVYLKMMDIVAEDGLRKLISMGEAAVKSVAQRFSQFGRFFNGYGPTEGSIAVSMHYVSSEAIADDMDIIPIGKAFGNAEMLLLDDALELVPVGVIGEICIGGTGVSRGYLNKPGLTAEKFITHPYRSGKRLYRTGDLGRRKEDGNIEFIGRKDDQVKLRGQRIELGEIEKVLCTYENITDALVVLKEQPEGDKYLAAYVINPSTEKRVSVQVLRNYLLAKLPAYMVPSAFSVLDSFPLTPNGKIDRKALPEPQEGDTAGENAYVAPRTEPERLLVEVCEDILRHSGIGMLDDFFALGGDSIKSIQLVSRMRQQGYHLQVGDVLDYPLLEDMSRRIRKGVRAIPQGPVTGEVLPGPIQLAYLQSEQPDKHHYNQAVLLRSSERLDVESLQAIFAIIVSHHDALRMVFRYDENKWRQHNLGLDQRHGMTVRDLRGAADWRIEMEQHCVAVQSGISLSEGPLFHACVFQCPDEDRLLLVAHHLVVDGVSWRILLEDLGTLYEQGIVGQPMKLPQKTDSLQYWMEQQHRYASSPALLAEVPYWKAITEQTLPSFPVDDATGSNSFSDENTVSFLLGKEDTSLLQTRCYQAYNTEMNDILLTVLGLAVKESLGTDRFLVQLEGHGREHIGADIDVTRTVGWFTSVYPVLMDYSAQHTAVRHLIETKERLHRIPNKGIGFGMLRHLSPALLQDGLTYSVAPAITFNYLGDFNSGTGNRADNSNPLFKLSGEAHGSAVSDQQHRDTLLTVTGIIVNGELRISVSYSSKQYRKPTIDRLLDSYRQMLGDLISVLTQARKQLTPVDLTYTGLKIDELSALTSRSEIEDIYELTPFQRDLFQLWKNKAAAPEVYFLQLNYGIRGNLDKELLQQSYHYVVAGNANLRTTFTDDFGVPLQVVHRSIPGGFHYEDVRGNEDFVLEEFLKKDRRAGIDLENSSPVRLNIFRTGEDGYHFVWSKHHIIMDGWCGSILVKEFYNAYTTLVKGQQLLPGKQHLYSSYIKWLSERDESAEFSYWTDYMNGYRNPVKGRWKITDTQGAYEEQEAHLLTGTDLALKVKERCAALGITENVMLQTIWGLLLTKLRGTDDIVFGAIVSGRPDSLEGIETMLGAFINTIPIRISYDQSPLSTFMKKVHRNNIAATRYHHVDLDKLEKQCGYNQPLVDNLFVFENYPVQDLVEEKIRKEGEGLHMEVRSTELFEVNRYPLSLVIFSSRTIFIKFKYKNTVKPELVSLFITYFERMIAAVADDPFRQAKDYSCLQEFEMALNEITQTTTGI